MAQTDERLDRVREALARLRNPRTGKGLLESRQVADVEVDGEGVVRLSLKLRPDDPPGLAKEVRSALEGVPGVSRVRVNVRLPGAAPGGGSVPGPGPARGGGAGGRPGAVPAPTPPPRLLPGVQWVVAVSSGKGGVGKSMVAANVAASLALDGRRVGLLDADIYGPDIPVMFGERRRPRVAGEVGKELIEPLVAHGVRIMSLGLLLDEEQPAIMRGPLIAGILRQFLEQVAWGELDVLVVDMPPGTGDAQLSLVQTIDVEGAVMVTLPQQISTADVLRGIRMFERVNTPVLGIVENMSGFVCPHCGERADIFGSGGGRALAERAGVPFLGAVPLDPAVRESGDEGVPIVVGRPDSPAARALRGVAREVMAAVERVPA